MTGAVANDWAITYDRKVPEISRFLGIVIAMYYRDHEPAHFHAYSGEFEVTVEIESGIVTGRFPQPGLGYVLDWHKLHKVELQEDWNLARNSKPLKKIEPLE